VQRAPQTMLGRADRSRQPWIRAFLLEARRSDLMVSVFKKSQRRNKRAGRAEGIIRLHLGPMNTVASNVQPEQHSSVFVPHSSIFRPPRTNVSS